MPKARMEKRDEAAAEEPGKCYWTVGCRNMHTGRTKEYYFKMMGGTGTAEPEITGVSRGRSSGQTEAGGLHHQKV